LLETLEVRSDGWSCWSRASCAQGRRATRLRSAPTCSAHPILRHFSTLLLLRSVMFLSAVQKLRQILAWERPCAAIQRHFVSPTEKPAPQQVGVHRRWLVGASDGLYNRARNQNYLLSGTASRACECGHANGKAGKNSEASRFAHRCGSERYHPAVWNHSRALCACCRHSAAAFLPG
jgi:hypothetical protein